MATVYIDSNKYLDEVTYAQGDTLTVRYGAVLTQRVSNTVYPTAINGTEGKFKIDAFATGAVTPIVLTMNTANTGIVLTQNGVVEARGDWQVLGTGNGGAAQEFTFYHSHCPAYCQVETGNGTNVWTTCLSISDNAFTTVGAGVILGKYFQFNEATSKIIFGNGTNGMVVPNGARVRVPNIFITANLTWGATAGLKGALGSSTGQCSFDLDRAMVSNRMMINIYNPAYAILNNFGCFQSVLQSTFNLDTTGGWYLGCDRAGSTIATITSSYCKVTLDNVHACNWNTNVIAGVGFTSVVARNCYFAMVNNSAAYVWDARYHTKLIFEDSYLIGAGIAFSNNKDVEIRRVQYSANLTGAEVTSINTRAYDMGYTSNWLIEDTTIIPGGIGPYDVCIYCNQAYEGKALNNDFGDNTSANCLMYASYNSENNLFYNNRVGTLRTRVLVPSTNSKNNTYIKNYANAGGGAISPYCTGGKVVGMTSPNPIGTSIGFSNDLPYVLTYSVGDRSTGFLVMTAYTPNLKQTFTITAGTPVCSKSGSWLMRTSGDQMIWETGETINGISSFRDAALAYNGSNVPTNFTYEYSLKIGGAAWTAWQDLTTANLIAETVSASTGFQFRLRITCTTTNTANAVSLVNIPVNIDTTYEYPILSGSYTLTGLKEGTEVHIYRTSDDAELSGTESVTGTSYTYNYLVSSSTPVYITILKVGYEWLRIDGEALDGTVKSIPVFQKIDRNFINP